MNDPMTILKADHREVKKMLNTLGDTEEGAGRRELLSTLDRELRLHMQIEESLVYPPVASEVGEEDAEEANIEHGLARETLQKLAAMVDAPGFGAAVEMLKGGISHHVEEEETELLPELKSALDRKSWLALGDQIATAKAEAGAAPPKPTTRRSSKRAPKKK